jgi:hypothetical protein
LFLSSNIEDELNKFCKRNDIKVDYDEVSSSPFTHTVNFKQVLFQYQGKIFDVDLTTEKLKINFSITRLLSSFSMVKSLKAIFKKPILILKPDKNSIFGYEEKVLSEGDNLSDISQQFNPEVYQDEILTASLIYPFLKTQIKANNDENNTITTPITYPEFEINYGRVVIKRGKDVKTFATDIGGFIRDEVSIKFHLLEDENWSYIKRESKDKPLILEKTTTDVHQLKTTIFPKLKMSFSDVIIHLSATFHSAENYSINSNLIGGEFQVGNKFIATNYDTSITFTDKDASINHSHLAWRGSKLEVSGKITNLDTGAIKLKITSDRVRMQDLISLTGYSNVISPGAGELILLIEGTIDNPAYYIRYEKQ